jgi:hypothetical protein
MAISIGIGVFVFVVVYVGGTRIMATLERHKATAKDAINAMVEALNEAISDFKETFADIATAIEELKDEEQEKFDNMPEGLQNGERGQAIEATVNQLETALDAANNVSEIEDFEFDFDSDEIITALASHLRPVPT